MHNPAVTTDTDTVPGYKIEVFYDDDSMSPRDWDNIGKFSWYSKGWRNDTPESETELETPNTVYGIGNDKPLEFHCRYVRAIGGVAIPVQFYSHGGSSISYGTENADVRDCDDWANGVYTVWPETLKKEYESTGIDPDEWVERAFACAQGELHEYAQYLEGYVYGYVVTNLENDEIGDSVWGFIGDSDYALGEGIEAAKAAVSRSKAVTKAVEGYTSAS